jgi:hypothetical protein
LEDTEGPQHISAIVQGTGLDRRVVDPVLSRGVKAGVFLRVAEATYALAPEKPAEPLPPAPQDVPRADGIPASAWLDWLWSWHRGAQWEGPGSPPDKVQGIMVANCAVPLDVFMQFQGELFAVMKHEAEDDALRDRLLACANGNARMGRPLQDMRAVKIMLASGLSIEDLEFAVRQQFDRRHNPKAGMLSSWADLFPRAAKNYALSTVPKLVARWNATLADPGATTDKSPTLRRAMAEIAPQPAGRELEPVASVPHPSAPEVAPAPPPTQPAANPADGEPSAAALLLQRFGGGLDEAAAAVSSNDDDGAPPLSPPVAEDRNAILARFRRSPAAPDVPPPVRADRGEMAERVRDRRQGDGARPVTSEASVGNRPWFAPSPAVPQEDVPGMSADVVDEYLQAWRIGNIDFPRRLLGPAPGEPGCLLTRATLRRNGL